jgi:shikimate kinase
MKYGNIILTGMAGAGKSTIGVLLAKRLGMDFVDTDIVLQQSTGRLLQEILDEDGVRHFLEIEEAVVSGLHVTNCVVATGGSVVYSKKAMTALGKEGKIFYLSVAYEELVQRLTNISTRGIVMKKGKTLVDVYKERLPLYKKYADFTIACSGAGIETCISRIIQCCSSLDN